MLKETPQEKGCLRGCLFSFVLGGFSGGIVGYFFSTQYFAHTHMTNSSFYLLLKAGYVMVGFLIGMFVWWLGQVIYVKLFMKNEEEETV